MSRPELALGCWQFGPSFGFWENHRRHDSLQLLHAALRENIRHFDSAASYGNGKSEQMLGHQVRRFSNTIGRDELCIATKIMPKTPLMVRKDVLKSLSRLCTPYLDILYLHWPSSKVDLKPILDAMKELKNEGLVRSLGLSNFPLSLLPLFDEYPISFLQTPCTLLWSEEMPLLLPYCKERSIKVVGYSPLGLGLLNGEHLSAPEDSRGSLYPFSEESYPSYKALYAILKTLSEEHQRPMAQIALAWAMDQGLDILLLGARNKVQLEQNLAARTISFTQDEKAKLARGASLLASTIPPGQDNLFGHRW